MLVLLSPSKTQDFDTAPPVAVHSDARLMDESALLMKELAKLPAKKIATLMTVSEKIATLNHKRFKSFKTPFTPENAKQAVFAFKGDVYDGLEAEGLSPAALDFAQEHVRILSGLYGVLRPLDLIQPYRLEMKTRLANARGKDLYHFWGSRITEVLNQDLAALGTTIVINLASEEYFKSVHVKALKATVITPQFKDKKKTGYQMIGLFAKRVRGAMARYITTHAITNTEALHFFAEDGYRWNASLSTKHIPVFTRG